MPTQNVRSVVLKGEENGFTRARSGIPPVSIRNSMHDPYADLGINERVIAINREQSDLYVRHESARDRHWATHPTRFACLKCMDGRMHLPSATNTPMGIVKPFRGIGGRFDVFWPSFIDRIEAWTEETKTYGARNCVFAGYHYSASSRELSCAGWSYDTAAAKQHALKLAADLAGIFQDQMTVIPMGVETDRDMLTFHGPEGDFSGQDCIGLDKIEIGKIVQRCIPHIDTQTLDDLTPFLEGNARRVKELTDEPRDLTLLGHQERIIALGESFDWLARQNFALINNDSDPNLDEAIVTAAKIIKANLESAPPEEQVTILTNASYAKPGQKHRKAIARARGLQKFAQMHIQKAHPDLFNSNRLHYLVGVTFEPSKKLEVIEQGICGQ